MNLLSSLRGEIVDARLAYPDVLHVEIRGSAGELSRLATQDGGVRWQALGQLGAGGGACRRSSWR